jgi:putative transposase
LKSWQANWPNLVTFFAYPTDDSVKKVVWLAIQSASQKWAMPLKDWRMAMSRFIIEFGDRLDGHF